MALLFKCLSECGFRDCLLRKFAFYPPTPGYRFSEVPSITELPQKEGSGYGDQTIFNRNTIDNICSRHCGKHYELILVYDEQEVQTLPEVKTEQDLIKEKDKQKLHAEYLDNSYLQREEKFIQTEGLHLTCFKRRSRDDQLICGYHIEFTKRQSDIIAIYSHGNSTDIGYMINQALDMAFNLRINVIAYDYRGYGISIGLPSDRGLIFDLEAIYDLAIELGYAPGNIILYGQSVGSGPSSVLAASTQYPIGGLIIHSGFASGMRIMQEFSKWPKTTYKKDFFPTLDFINSVNAPVLIIHGTDDTDISINHARQLQEKTKQRYTPFFLEVQGGGHNDIEHQENFRRQYFAKLREFVRKIQIHDFQENQNGGFSGDGIRNSFNHIYKTLIIEGKEQLGSKRNIHKAYKKREQIKASRIHQGEQKIPQERVIPANWNDFQLSVEQTQSEIIKGSISDNDKFMQEEEEEQEIKSFSVGSVMRMRQDSYFSSVIVDAGQSKPDIHRRESIRSNRRQAQSQSFQKQITNRSSSSQSLPKNFSLSAVQQVPSDASLNNNLPISFESLASLPESEEKRDQPKGDNVIVTNDSLREQFI